MMNDGMTAESPAPENAHAETSNARSPLMRQLVLIAILVLMLGALYWDRQVARPGSEAKKAELDDLAAKRLTTSEPQLSQAEVAEALGRQPSNSREADGYLIEKFVWRGGLPWRTYDVNVVYTKEKEGGGRYYASFYNEEPEDAMLETTSEPVDTDAPAPEDVGGGGGLPVAGGGGGIPSEDSGNNADPGGGRPALEDDEPTKSNGETTKKTTAAADSDPAP